MFKALLKKELSQLLYVYTFDQRKKRPRKKGAVIALIALMCFALISFSSMFFWLYMSVAEALSGPDEAWLLFALAGAVTLGIGVIGSVFSTYAMLYKARDNEFLLAMPIPPSMILLVRMLMVYLTGLVSCAVAWLPAVAVGALAFGFSPLPFLAELLMLILLTAAVTVVSSILGWLIALIVRRMKNTTFITVLISLVFIGGYYFLYFRMRAILASVIENLSGIAEAMHGWAYPLMLIGRGARAELLPLLAVALAAGAAFFLMCFVLSKTLFSVLTASAGGKKAVYRAKDEKRGGVFPALVKRELKRFISSPTLILNTGFGILLLIAGSVFALVKAEAVRGFISNSGMFSVLTPVLPAAAYTVVCVISSMDCFTASAVSLEGRRLWLVQTLPVKASLVLKAKEITHLILNGVPAVFAGAALGTVLELGVPETVFVALSAFLTVWLSGAFGLMLNVSKPTLDWTNEAVPVKQGLPVLFTMLFGFGASIFLGISAAGISFFLGAIPGLAAAIAVEGLFIFLIDWWLSRRGAEIFAHLT